MKKILLLVPFILLFAGCATAPAEAPKAAPKTCEYLVTYWQKNDGGGWGFGNFTSKITEPNEVDDVAVKEWVRYAYEQNPKTVGVVLTGFSKMSCK